MNTERHVALVLAALLWAGASAARGQDERYRERQVLDPNAGTWVERSERTVRPGDVLDQARGFLAEGDPREARELLEDWVEDNIDDERYYEGVFLLGEAHYELRDFWEAVEQYQFVAENASGELFERANERAVDVARAFLSGQKRKLWKIFRLPAYEEALEILDRVWERMPGTPLGEYALWLRAGHHYSRGEMGLAEDEYAFIVQQYPAGRYLQLAMLRSAEAAEAAFGGIKFDAQPLLEAAERYRQVLETFPAYARKENVPQRLEGVRQSRAAKDYDIGRWYERTGQTGAAEFYYRQVLEDWPDTLAAAEARTRLRALGVADADETMPEVRRTGP